MINCVNSLLYVIKTILKVFVLSKELVIFPTKLTIAISAISEAKLAV